jgi:hypothetical protein
MIPTVNRRAIPTTPAAAEAAAVTIMAVADPAACSAA